jgi:hypothetical protein
MSVPKCPDCHRDLDVTIRKGKRVVEAHECPGPSEKGPNPRQDAPHPIPPGSGEGPMRYGRPAGPGAQAFGMPPISLAPIPPETIRACHGGRADWARGGVGLSVRLWPDQ